MSKFKQCVAAIFDQTSGDNSPCAWHYNADLFPHIPDFSLEALQNRRQVDFSACRNYTPIAVPSVSFSGMYHVIHITTTTNDLNVKYHGCYPEGYIDAYNPALWIDEALSWSRDLPQRKPSQEVTDIYLVDSNGHQKYGVTVSQSCNAETVESWDDVILHVTTNQLEAQELHGGFLVRSSSDVCGSCWSWLAGNKCPGCYAAVGSYPVYSRIRLPLPPKVLSVLEPPKSGFKTLKNLESEWERAGDVAIGAELLQRYYNLRYEKSHCAAIHTIIDSVLNECLQSHDIPPLAIIPGLALCCKIYADQGLNFDTHPEAIDEKLRELSQTDDFTLREFKACVGMDIHSLCTDLQKHARS
jgi:hypothetical protein